MQAILRLAPPEEGDLLITRGKCTWKTGKSDALSTQKCSKPKPKINPRDEVMCI